MQLESSGQDQLKVLDRNISCNLTFVIEFEFGEGEVSIATHLNSIIYVCQA